MNMYLLKSDCDRERIGDVVINLNKILVIKSAMMKEGFVLVIEYTHEDAVKVLFKTKESLVKSLEDILGAMGSDMEIAKHMVISDRREDCAKKEALKNILEELQKVQS